MTVYNFEELQKRFVSMTFVEILEEYAKIQRDIAVTEKMPFESKEFYLHREPLDEAKDYLGFYIAGVCCEEHGIHIFD